MHLIEGFSISKENIKRIPITEDTKVIEKNGEKFSCRAAYEFPVWKLGEKNLNERVYGKKLAEKLIKEQPVTLGLTNHPKGDDVDVGNTFAVERNPHIKNNIMYVEAYLVGDKGQLAHEIIEAGGSIGLSSSAFGDVDEDGNVLEEGFQIDRFADWVDNPSYQVFAKKEDSISEESENKDTNILEKSDSDGSDIKEINIMADTAKEKVLSIEEKNFKKGVKDLFREAESKTELKEKLNVYQEILDYCEGVDFAKEYEEKAQSKIDEINEELISLAESAKEVAPLKESLESAGSEKQKVEEKVKEIEEELEKTTSSFAELQEKYEISTDLLESMKLREKKLKEMYKVAIAEKNGMVTASEYKEVLSYSEEVEKENEELKKENASLKKRNRQYRERLSEKGDSDKKKKDDSEEDESEEKDDDEEKDEKKEMKKDKKKKEDVNYDDIDPEITIYYEDLVAENPNVEKIKEELLGCRTILEAQMKYLKLKDLVEEDYSSYLNRLEDSDEDTTYHLSEKSESRRSSMPKRQGWV